MQFEYKKRGNVLEKLAAPPTGGGKWLSTGVLILIERKKAPFSKTLTQIAVKLLRICSSSDLYESLPEVPLFHLSTSLGCAGRHPLTRTPPPGTNHPTQTCCKIRRLVAVWEQQHFESQTLTHITKPLFIHKSPPSGAHLHTPTHQPPPHRRWPHSHVQERRHDITLVCPVVQTRASSSRTRVEFSASVKIRPCARTRTDGESEEWASGVNRDLTQEWKLAQRPDHISALWRWVWLRWVWLTQSSVFVRQVLVYPVLLFCFFQSVSPANYIL